MPTARPPEPAKFRRVRAASCLVSSFVYMNSRPISRFGTGFQIVRVPTFHTLKSGLQPATAEASVPVGGVNGAAALRIGLCGDEQNSSWAVELNVVES